MKKVFLLVLLTAGCLLTAEPVKEMTLIRNGKTQFRIVTSGRKSRQLNIAIRSIKEALLESSGTGVDVVTADKLPAQKAKLINLHLGNGEYAKSKGLKMPGPNGFIIAFPDDKNIVIAGVSIVGEEFNTLDGVVWFLENYLGVRYLLPGEIGTHIPKLKGDWKVPMKNITRVPNIFARQFSGVHGQAYGRGERTEQNGVTDWAFRVSMCGSVSLKLNHNVGNLIHPDKYMKTHPEFFPLIYGKRVFPPKTKHHNWHLNNWEPCYTADGIAEEAAKSVIEHFKKNPDLYSCSLSCNDSGNICQCEKCKKVNAGLPEGSESQTYYEWVCKVVDIVKKQYPDRYYGILNYWATKEAPRGLKLDPHVIPIVCEDLKFDVDPECRANLERELAKWDKAASSIGWWDYSFEGDYMVPAYNAHYLAKMLKHLYKNHNLRVYTNELHPGKYYQNAPEVYMVMKLLWDIDRDPDELLNEWFDLAVGKEAAPYFKKYFAVWENFWTNKIPKTQWFRSRIGVPFLQRRDGVYLDALSYEDIAEALDNLKKAAELAPAGKQKARAQFFLNRFAYCADALLLPYINGKNLHASLKNPKTKLLKHYTWDKDVEKWVSWQNAGHTAKLWHDKTVGRTGKGALATDLRSSIDTGMCWYRRPLDFKMEPGKNYRVSVWCKGEGISEKGRIRMVLYFPLKGKGVLGREPGRAGAVCFIDTVRSDVLKDGKWHKLECSVAVPETAWNHVAGIDVQLEVGTTQRDSKGWFDDLKIEEILDPVKTYPEFRYQPPKAVETVYIDPETNEKLGPELIVDGDMEAEDAAAWSNSYTPKVKEKSTKFFKSGKRSLHIVSDSSGDGALQIIKPFKVRGLFHIPYKGIEKGKKYRVQLWFKNMNPKGWNDLRLAGTDLKMPLKSTDTEWHKVVFRATAKNPPVTDYITVGYGTDKSDMYVDDISVREILSSK